MSWSLVAQIGALAGIGCVVGIVVGAVVAVIQERKGQ